MSYHHRLYMSTKKPNNQLSIIDYLNFLIFMPHFLFHVASTSSLTSSAHNLLNVPTLLSPLAHRNSGWQVVSERPPSPLSRWWKALQWQWAQSSRCTSKNWYLWYSSPWFTTPRRSKSLARYGRLDSTDFYTYTLFFVHVVNCSEWVLFTFCCFTLGMKIFVIDIHKEELSPHAFQ